MTERIVVRIGRHGQVEAHTEGTRGPGCLDAIPLLEDLLQSNVVDSRYTSDFYAVNTSDALQQQVLEEGEAQ